MKEMSHSFGVDFGGVKVHDDTEAAHLNKELNALAFTHGNDIYFNAGKFEPENSSGKFLLAHELTHVVQQGAAGGAYKKNEGSIQKKADDADAADNVGASGGVTAPTPAGTGSCGKPAHCPEAFCTPFLSTFVAGQARDAASSFFACRHCYSSKPQGSAAMEPVPFWWRRTAGPEQPIRGRFYFFCYYGRSHNVFNQCNKSTVCRIAASVFRRWQSSCFKPCYAYTICHFQP